VLASSVEIYGEGAEQPMREDFCGRINCNTARAGYNEAKRVSESLCQSFAEQYGVQCVIARLARVFGADKKEDSKALAQFMQKAVNGEDIILKSKGLQRFSYCYIADAVSGILKLLFDGKSGEAYNISDEDNGMTLGDIAQYIAQLANVKIVFAIENDSAVSKAQYAILDCAKLKALGWQPIWTIGNALERTYKILSERDWNGNQRNCSRL
jgi:nucleoside-diphosphate-sugar epimerase